MFSVSWLLKIMLLEHGGAGVAGTYSFVFYGYVPRGGTAGSSGSSLFNFWRDLHSVLHSDSTDVRSHQWCPRIPFAPHPHQHLLPLDFLRVALPADVM